MHCISTFNISRVQVTAINQFHKVTNVLLVNIDGRIRSMGVQEIAKQISAISARVPRFSKPLSRVFYCNFIFGIGR